MPRRIRTILYGDQAIEATELDLLHTPALQRLYDLHQLGLADRVYVDASHSRLQHVIGVLAQVDNIIQAIAANLSRRKQRNLEFRNSDGTITTMTAVDLSHYVRKRKRAARLMGLLHDLTHAPYGHTLEDEINLQAQKHDHPARQADAFFRLICQYIGWLAIERGTADPFGGLRPRVAGEVTGTPAERFAAFMDDPVLAEPGTDQPLLEYVAGLATPLFERRRQGRALGRPPSRRELIRLFRDLRFAMRALLWLDALHKDRLQDLLPGVPPADRQISEDGSYPFERLIDLVLSKVEDERQPDLPFMLQRDAFLLDVIGNTICADLLDYAKRDSHFAGLKLDYDVDRIVENFTLVSHHRDRQPNGAFAAEYGALEPMLRTAISIFSHKLRIDAPGELMNLLQVRFYVYQRVLFHPTKCTAGAMLGSALHLMGWQQLPVQYRFVGDAVFLSEISEVARLVRDLLMTLPKKVAQDHQQKLGSAVPELTAVLRGLPVTKVTNAAGSLLQVRAEDSIPKVLQDLQASIQLLGRLGARRYHRAIFRLLPNVGTAGAAWSADSIATYFREASPRALAEREIERRAGLPAGTVTIHCPSGEGPRKIAEILILSERKGGERAVSLRSIGSLDHKIFAKHQEAIKALEEMYASMWRLVVSVAAPFCDRHEELNATIGRVLYAALRRQPYDREFGDLSEAELTRKGVMGVSNDENMQLELNESTSADGDQVPNVLVSYDDGHEEVVPEPFMVVASRAVHRLQHVSEPVRGFVKTGRWAAGKSQPETLDQVLDQAIPEAAVDDLVNDAIGAAAPRSLELFREPAPSGLIAARVTAPPEPTPTGGRDAELPPVLFTDEQVFRAKMQELASGRTGSRRYETLIGWAQTGGLVPLARYPATVRFLDFLYATLKQHHGPTWVYSPKHLTRWFTEFNAGQQLGTKS